MPIFEVYHGTSEKNANNIIKNGFNIHNKIGWLGTGIYFYQNDFNMASNWANNKYKTTSINIIRCIVDIDNEYIFDTTDPLSENNKLFTAMREGLLESIKNNQIDIAVENEKDYDGKVYNLISEAYGYKLIRAYTYTYTNKDREMKTFSRVPNGIEICLKEQRFISQKEII